MQQCKFLLSIQNEIRKKKKRHRTNLGVFGKGKHLKWTFDVHDEVEDLSQVWSIIDAHKTGGVMNPMNASIANWGEEAENILRGQCFIKPRHIEHIRAVGCNVRSFQVEETNSKSR
jgi:hypothetical protein